ASAFIKIEPLNAENYDTWKLQMSAILVKSDLWSYVNGSKLCPDAEAEQAAWEKQDEKARADILLSISPSELALIENCESAREYWLKLQETFQSKGPVHIGMKCLYFGHNLRKASLLKRVALSRMTEGSDERQHINDSFEAVKKFKEIGVAIGDDLLAILLLYSLPDSYETFRCAIETRDELPNPDILRVK
ncbi:hypothetical protein KR215_009956, partial [Drosophila sulfurigaster]